MRTAIGKVRGLGAAGTGPHHWWMQRVSAIALVPLTVWFIVSIVALTGADHATITAWLANPLSAALMLLFLVVGFYHLKLGLQIIIEDYVHSEPLKIATLLTSTFGCYLVGLLAVLALLRIFIEGASA